MFRPLANEPGKRAEIEPAHLHHCVGFGRGRDPDGALFNEDLGHLKLDQAAAHVGAVLDDSLGLRVETGEAELFAQTADRTCACRLPPFQMGSAGVGPETWRVVFSQRPTLEKCGILADDENRDRLVPQSKSMDLEVLDRDQCTVNPGGDQAHPTLAGGTGRARWANFFCPIFRCAMGRAWTSFLFISASKIRR